ncbi:MAG: hypothetical protein AABY16_01750 [Nanoarchaeota archaeon]
MNEKKFEYTWKNNEANFGPPIARQVNGGAHINFEIILRYNGKFVALRRPKAIPEHEMPPGAQKYPKGLLYFCHNLIRYGESVEVCVQRIVSSQCGADVLSYKIIDISSDFQEKDKQWAFMPYVLAEIKELPKKGNYGNEITEIVVFNKRDIPQDFGWWTKEELKEFIEMYKI